MPIEQTRHFGAPVRRGPGTAAATRRELLVAAEDVLARRGDAGRLEDVAAAAGVAKSALFRHWSSKEELVAEVRLRSAERHRGWVEHAVAHGVDPIAGVTGATVGFFALHRNALFDPLVTRGALVEPAPELEALGGLLDGRATEIVGGSGSGSGAYDRTGADVRTLLDAMVLGTTRGWLGTPGLDELVVPTAILDVVLATLLRDGLAAVGPVASPGRRPRRPPTRSLGAGDSDRDRREGALLDAALPVFAEAGYESARLEDVAAAGHTTASALFTYWPGKEALFLQLRRQASAQIAAPIMAAVTRVGAAGGSAATRLRAAVAADIRAHYDRPEFQSILLPVPTLPPEAELESVGWNATIEQVGLLPDLGPAGPIVPVATAIGLSVLRLTVLAMHRNAIHPDVATAIAADYLAGGIAGLAALAGIPFD